MHDHKSLKKAWEETNKSVFLSRLEELKEENVKKYLKEVCGKKWEKVFEKSRKKRVLICADERTVSSQNEFKIGIAGQTILLDKKEKEEFIKKMQGKIQEVRSHSGCGAAGIACKNFKEEEKQKIEKMAQDMGFCLGECLKEKNISDSDKLGLCYSFCLAKKIKASFSHTPFKGMRGEKEFHDARIIFWSSHKNFDPTFLLNKILPPHFLANGLSVGVGEKYAKAELKILSGIALSDHGFGKLFNKKNPFLVISVGQNSKEGKDLNAKAKKVLKEFGDKVRFLYL